MSNSKLTKKDPKEQIAKWTEYKKTKIKENIDLPRLGALRRHALWTKLGSIIILSVVGIIICLYFISFKSSVRSVKLVGADEIDGAKVAKIIDVSPKTKVVFSLFKGKEYSKKISRVFPEVDTVKITVTNWNNLILHIKEKRVIGYVKENNHYRKILFNGKVSRQDISEKLVDISKPLFLGYSRQKSIINDLKVYKALPPYFRDKIKMISGKIRRPNQIILLLNDHNIIIGDVNTFAEKIKYYDSIKKQLTQPSIIDMEVGVFSRPLTVKDKEQYEINC